LNVKGVSALNHNETDKALDFFREAYKFDPQSAFSLNNMGYVSEAFGDQETADEFYNAARRGNQAGTPVSAASHHEMVGEAVAQVADSNAQGSEANLQAEAEVRRRNHAPIVLKHRDNSPIAAPPSSETPAPAPAPQTQNPPYPRPPIDNAPVENTVPSPPRP
jgi:Flp pilus assembly protein TadD